MPTLPLELQDSFALVWDIDSTAPPMFKLTSLPVGAALAGATMLALACHFAQQAVDMSIPAIDLVVPLAVFGGFILMYRRAAIRYDRTLTSALHGQA